MMHTYFNTEYVLYVFQFSYAQSMDLNWKQNPQ